jgi:hypothetical protein
MSLKSETKPALDALGSLVAVPHQLDVQDGRRRLTGELVGVDAIGLSFQQLMLETDELAGATMDRLKAISEDLAKRLTYLMEPISPIEFDADGCTVQLRSSPPQKDDDGTAYYELLVHQGGDLSLRRYHKSAGGQRQSIPANVTREVFVRLVGDLDAAIP